MRFLYIISIMRVSYRQRRTENDAPTMRPGETRLAMIADAPVIAQFHDISWRESFDETIPRRC